MNKPEPSFSFKSELKAAQDAITQWVYQHPAPPDPTSIANLNWLTSLTYSRTQHIGYWQLRCNALEQIEIWIYFDGVEAQVPLKQETGLCMTQFDAIVQFIQHNDFRDRSRFSEEAFYAATPEQPLYLIFSQQYNSPQIIISRPALLKTSDHPLCNWSHTAIEAIDKMCRHPNGLVISAHRYWSSSKRGSSNQLFQHIFQHVAQTIPFGRPVFIGSSLEGMPYTPNGIYLQVEREEDSAWAEACQTAVSLSAPLLYLRGRDAQMVLKQAVITALEDCRVVADVPLIGVVDTLEWMVSLPNVNPKELAEVLLGIASAYPDVLSICLHCKEPMDLQQAQLEAFYPAAENSCGLVERLQEEGVELPEGNWMCGTGCDRCHGRGYQTIDSSRLTIAEAIYVDRALARLISTSPDAQQIKAALRERQFCSYWDNALALAQQGKISLQSAIYRSFGRRVEF